MPETDFTEEICLLNTKSSSAAINRRLKEGEQMLQQILVIDDDPLAQNELRKELENDGAEVVCVSSVYEALQTFLNRELSLVILDVGLSECDGYRLLEVMQTAKPIPILALSSKSRKPYKGVDSAKCEDFLCAGKPYCLQDSLKLAQQAIHSCIACDAQSQYHYTLVCGKDLIINPDKREVLLKGHPLELTRKEFDLLFCLARHPGQVLSREQLYSQVWAEDKAINVDEVVKTHIKTIRKKLSQAGTEYIQNVWGVGYRFQIDQGGE
ncbi:MAG: response regulator transcription factor [Oliverpabstia sp.]